MGRPWEGIMSIDAFQEKIVDRDDAVAVDRQWTFGT
jgi:hypothetical protein